MLVCDDPPFVGYMPPKTGCVSVMRALCSEFDCRFRRGLHGRRVDHRLAEHFHFLLVRNPFPRAVSYWWHYRTVDLEQGSPMSDSAPGWPSELRREHYERAREMTFREFCLSDLSELLVPCALWHDKMIRVDAVLHTETLAKDFHGLTFHPTAKHPLPSVGHIELPHLNVGRSGYGDWREHYDEDCERIVSQRLWRDFQFGYRPELSRHGVSKV